MENVVLRDILESDIPIFFEQQLDSDANHMVAFTAKDPTDREAFNTKWARILNDPTIIKKTILFEDAVVGQLVKFQQFDKPSVSYRLGKEYWGKGLATQALLLFLAYINIRPLYARAAKDNIGSIRVLEKCGFKIHGEDKGFANARGEEIEEFILKLSTYEKTDDSVD